MPKINVNSRDNFSSIYGIVDKYADTISQPVNPDSDVVFKNMVLTETLTVQGNLTVSGSTTTITADVIELKDNIIEINSGETGSGVSANLSGIRIDRGTLPSYDFVYEESTDTFKIGQTSDLQPVATREDNPLSGGVMIFDNNSRLLISTNNIVNDIYFSGSPTVSSTTGAITTDGLGVSGDIFMSGFINFGNSSNTINTSNNDLVISSGNNVNFNITSGNSIKIPELVDLQFNQNSSISTKITPGLHINSTENITADAPVFNISSGTDLVFSDNNNVDYTNLNFNGSLLNIFSRVSVGDFTNSFSGQTGALIVSGGIGVSSSEEAFSSSNGGALTVSGGAGITKKLFVGGDASFSQTLTVLKKSNLLETVIVGSDTSGTTTSNTISGNLANPLGLGVADFSYTDTETPSLGVITNANSSYFGQNTVSALNSGVGITNANTVFIKGPPILGSNVFITDYYALNVNSGNTRLGGNLSVSSSSTLSGKLTVTNDTDITGALKLGSLTTINTEANNQGKLLNITPTNLNDAITTGIASEMFFNRISSGSLSSTAVITTTTAATLVIDNAPITGNNQTIINSYALLIKSGNSKFRNIYTDDIVCSGSLDVSGSTNISTISSDTLTSKILVITDQTDINGSIEITQDTSFVKFSQFRTPTVINPDNYVIDNSATVYIQGPLTGSVESYSLFVEQGKSQFQEIIASSLQVSGAVDLAGGLSVETSGVAFLTVEPTNVILSNGNSVIDMNTTNTSIQSDIVALSSTGSTSLTTGSFNISASSSSSISTTSGIIDIKPNGKLFLDSQTSIEIGRQSVPGMSILIGGNASNTTVGNDLLVLGDFIVTGETVTLNSSLLSTSNNSIVVNSMPFGASDGGLLVRRYQIPNDNSQGQVVNNDTPISGEFSQNSDGNLLYLEQGQSYVGWWIKFSDGSGQVRRIKSYDSQTGASEIYGTADNTENFEDGLDLSTPAVQSQFYNVYPGTFAGMFFNDTDNEWVIGKVPIDQNSGTFPVSEYADLRAGYITAEKGMVVGTQFNTSVRFRDDLFSVFNDVAGMRVLQVSSINVSITGPVNSNLQFKVNEKVLSRLLTSQASGVDGSFNIQVLDNNVLTTKLSINNTSANCSNIFSITNNTPSTSSTTGALTVSGGVGITGATYIGGITRLSNTTQSTSTTTGALVISGGVGISGNVIAGGNLGLGINPVAKLHINSGNIRIDGTNVMEFGGGITKEVSAGRIGYQAFSTSLDIIGAGENNSTRSVRIFDNLIVDGSTASTSTTTGAIVVPGGVGIGGGVNIGGPTKITNSTQSLSTTTGALTVSGGVGIGGNVFCGFLDASSVAVGNLFIGSTSIFNTVPTGFLSIGVGIGDNSEGPLIEFSGNIFPGEADRGKMKLIAGSAGSFVNGVIEFNTGNTDRVRITGDGTVEILTSTTSTSTTTGALTVSGGVGIANNLYVGNNVSISGQIIAGEWAGQTISVANGGTGSTTFSANSLLIGNTTGAVSSLSSLTFITDTLTTPKITTTNTDASISSSSGPVVFSGGVSVSKNMYIGTELYTNGNVGIGTSVNVNSELTLVKNSNIGVNTLGGDDDGFLSISGGGSGLTSRGGNIALYGKEHASNAGSVILDGSVVVLKTAGNARITTDETGITTLSNTTASTSNSAGSVILSGGLAISNTTNSSSSTNGGSLTTAGGMAVEKDLHVGGDITVAGNVFSNSITVVSFLEADADIIESTNVSQVQMVSGKFTKIFGEKELRGVFLVTPNAIHETCEFSFQAVEGSFTGEYGVVPSTQGYTDVKSIENLVCVSIDQSSRVKIQFTSNSTNLHVIQYIIKY